MAKRWRKKFNGARLRPGSRSLERAKAGESVATPQPPMGLAGSDALPSACPDQRPLRPCHAPPGGGRAPALIAPHPAGRQALRSLQRGLRCRRPSGGRGQAGPGYRGGGRGVGIGPYLTNHSFLEFGISSTPADGDEPDRAIEPVG